MEKISPVDILHQRLQKILYPQVSGFRGVFTALLLPYNIILMYQHIDLGETLEERKKAVAGLIRSGSILLGGYKKDKIYGLLNCSSGKKMKVENRTFFRNRQEAISYGYRPCGHCMPYEYKLWKDEKKKSSACKRGGTAMLGEFYLLGGL